MGSVTHKLVLIFLLLCFQTQTLAALALSCAHGGGADAVADVCHQPATAAAERSDKSVPETPCFDCHKCQLGCAFGVAALPFGRSVDPTPENRAVTGPVFLRHFYRFIPDRPQRPPIFALS